MNEPIDYGRLTSALLLWRNLCQIAAVSAASWDSATRLVQSARALDEVARQQLAEALADSDRELSPLKDPLTLNLGAHRWLSAEREESYSDWLAWILQGIPDACEVLPLLSLGDIGATDFSGPMEVQREQVNEEGRTDIELRIARQALLLIEVKVQPTGPELNEQLRRYLHWAEKDPAKAKMFALVGVAEPLDIATPFVFTSWQTLCRGLRHYAVRVTVSDIMRAAAILIFCGAVEQNLLGISARPERFRAAATLDYLRYWRTDL